MAPLPLKPVRIQRLPEILINQIAAGEVIERPSSVVKELIENSLDAGAQKIEILLTDGGITEIQILDDGYGIEPEDLALALERHATSKVRRAEDLEGIQTFGFRGEALASIASVSSLEIRSRTRDASHGRRLVADFGLVQPGAEPVGMPAGTSVQVRHLFDRLPARKKFLRSAATEFSHSARIVRELALGNCQTTFQLHHQGRAISLYATTTREARVRECLRPTWDMLHIREEADGLSLEAFLSVPSVMNERSECLLFINQRPVRSRPLLQAVRNAYSACLPQSEPLGAIFLDLRHDWVDVNVHPQKWEVRCYGQERLFHWLYASVAKALPARVPPPPSDPVSPEENLATAPHGLLGPFAGRYALRETDEGIAIFDLRRELMRRTKATLSAQLDAQGVPACVLPVPEILSLEGELTATLQKHLALLHNLGFHTEPFGDGTFALHAAPASAGPDTLTHILQGLQRETNGDAKMAGVELLAEWIAEHGDLSSIIPGDGESFQIRFDALQKHFERGP